MREEEFFLMKHTNRFVPMWSCGALPLIVFIWILLPLSPGWSQMTTATISGTVHDATEAVIPGATVTVRNLAAGRITDVATTGRQIQFALKLLF